MSAAAASPIDDIRAAVNLMWKQGLPLSPDMSLAIVTWLQDQVTRAEENSIVWQRPSAGVEQPPAIAWGDPEKLWQLLEHHYRHALAVSRAYLASQS